MNRRRFLARLGLLTAASVGLLPLLAACAGLPQLAFSTPAASGGRARISGGLQLPTFVPANVPPPELPATALVPAGYLKWPATLVKSVPTPPGSGGEVMVTTLTQTAHTPMDQNPWWQEVNKQLGVTLKLSLTPLTDYQYAKFPTIISGEISDLIEIYGVPIPIGSFFWVHWMHQELLEQIGSTPPTSADDYKRILQAVQKPDQGLYGINFEAGYEYYYGNGRGLFPGIFGAPNQWVVASDGTFRKDWETEPFKAAIGYTRDLVAAGVVDPNSPNLNTLSARQAFQARQAAFRFDGNTPLIYNAGTPLQAPLLNPPAKNRLVPPFPAQAGGKAAYMLWFGLFGFTALKQASAERIQELLRILNFFAAPFGTEEYLLLKYGLKDVHFTFDERGSPKATERAAADAVEWNYITAAPVVFFDPAGSDYASSVQATRKQYEPLAIEDPTWGLYSPTYSTTGITLKQKMGEAFTDIIAGRRPFSDYDQLVADWRSGGGDTIKAEYAAAKAG